ncbi:sister chromatid cohesion protein Dcc1 [Scheffersomyces amazonensis]|uniref:sister chromatid cohesion protein Dcc1 n=1 Tax=Scheffersomyces amazonensis TaxID=1078765 RepID=UPI00315DBEFD
MVQYSVFQQISNDPQYTYKLMQLPPELLTYLKNDNTDNELVLKSTINSDQVVICSDSKTWRLRQMNHSNTALICDNMNINLNHKITDPLIPGLEGEKINSFENQLIGFNSSSYEYELTPIAGKIEIENLPRYSGDKLSDDTLNVGTVNWTLAEILENSLISKHEFFAQWYELGGCIVDDYAYILTNEYITEILYLLITILISEEFNYKDDKANIDSIEKSVINQNHTINRSILETIIHKFGDDISSTTFKLNNSKIAQWFGIQTLSRTSSNLINPKDFLLQWKSSLPSFYNVSLDMHDLRGNYCCPIKDRILYVDQIGLSSNLSIRFVQLFQLDKSWNYDDFIPFIKDFVPHGKKVDSIILKYAKKKKLTKDKFLVVPR